MEMKSRVPGKIEEVYVNVGDAVKKGDKLYKVEAMKMLQEVVCPVDGTVSEIKIAVGDHIKSGAVAIIIG